MQASIELLLVYMIHIEWIKKYTSIDPKKAKTNFCVRSSPSTPTIAHYNGTLHWHPAMAPRPLPKLAVTFPPSARDSAFGISSNLQTIQTIKKYLSCCKMFLYLASLIAIAIKRLSAAPVWRGQLAGLGKRGSQAEISTASRPSQDFTTASWVSWSQIMRITIKICKF